MKYLVYPHGQGGRGGGIEPVGAFCEQGRGVFFAILCERLLWMTPNLNSADR